MRRSRWAGILLATTLGVGAAGCSSDPEPVDSPSTRVYSDQEEQAVAEAEQVVRARYATTSECLAAPAASDESCFDQVSTGGVLEIDRGTLREAQDNGFAYTGEYEVSKVEVEAVVLDAEPPRVVLSACLDTSRRTDIWPDGTSLKPSDLPTFYGVIYVVVNEQYPSPTGWRVADADMREEAQC